MATSNFILRVPKSLHNLLKLKAKAISCSLNEFCALALTQACLNEITEPSIIEAVEKASKLCGSSFLGAIVFGSYARGELRQSSDIDILIVLDDSGQITRSLYAKSIDLNLEQNGLPISLQFAKLPSKKHKVSSLWAEIAIEGMIVADTERRVHDFLVFVRGEISSGKLVRKILHGQPYWVRNEVA